MKRIWSFLDDRTVNELLNESWKTKLFCSDLPSELLIMMENWKVHFFQLSTTYPTVKQDLYASSQLAYTIVVLLRATESLLIWFKSHHKQLSDDEKLRVVTVNFMKILTRWTTSGTRTRTKSFRSS